MSRIPFDSLAVSCIYSTHSDIPQPFWKAEAVVTGRTAQSLQGTDLSVNRGSATLESGVRKLLSCLSLSFLIYKMGKNTYLELV